MDNNEDDITPAQMKKAWIVYSVLTVVVILVLVFFVASDNEEKLFFTLMTAAAGYVFRPTERFMKRQIKRFGGGASR